MKIPCEECLKYAICKMKPAVACTDLNRCLHDLTRSFKEKKAKELESIGAIHPVYLSEFHRQEAWDKAWETLHKHLPLVQGIYRDD